MRYRQAAVLLASCSLVACNMHMERKPEPKPISERQQSTAQHQSQEQSENQAPMAARQLSQSQNTYPPPSEDSAEVEVEEIRTDGQPEQTRRNLQAQSQTHRSPDGGNRAPSGGSSGPEYASENTVDRDEPSENSGTPAYTPTPDNEDRDMIGPQMNIGARTETEQMAALDSELDKQMAQFDELMRKARTAAETERSQQSGGLSSGKKDGRGERTNAAPEQRGMGGAGATTTGLGRTPDLSGETSGEHKQVAHANRSTGALDVRDDDIVARQLREAASKESDPLLRDKLWEEYRKYKSGL